MFSRKRTSQLEKMKNFIRNNEISKLKNMLKRGVDPGNCLYYFDESPLELAVDVNNAEVVKLLIEYGACKTSDGNMGPFGRAFTCAIWGEKTEIVALLLEVGIDPNSYTDGGYPHTYRAIDCAARKGNVEIVRMLIEKDADPNKGIYEGSPLINAIKGARKNEEAAGEIIKLLLAHGAKLRHIF